MVSVPGWFEHAGDDATLVMKLAIILDLCMFGIQNMPNTFPRLMRLDLQPRAQPRAARAISTPPALVTGHSPFPDHQFRERIQKSELVRVENVWPSFPRGKLELKLI